MHDHAIALAHGKPYRMAHQMSGKLRSKRSPIGKAPQKLGGISTLANTNEP